MDTLKKLKKRHNNFFRLVSLLWRCLNYQKEKKTPEIKETEKRNRPKLYIRAIDLWHSNVDTSLCTAIFWVAKGFETHENKFFSLLSFGVKPGDTWIYVFFFSFYTPYLFLSEWDSVDWFEWFEWLANDIFSIHLWLTCFSSLLFSPLFSLLNLVLSTDSSSLLSFSSCPSRVDSLASFYRFSFASPSKLNKKHSTPPEILFFK